jgi:hypothetical protein
MPPPQETIFTRPEEDQGSRVEREGATIAAADPFDPSPIIQRALGSKTADQKSVVSLSASRSCEDLDGSYPNLDSVVSISSSAASTPYRDSTVRTYGSRKRKEDSADDAPAAASTPAKLAVLHQPWASLVPLPSSVVMPRGVPAVNAAPVRFPVPIRLQGAPPLPGSGQPVRLVLMPARQPGPAAVVGHRIASPVRLAPPTVFRPNQDFSQRLLLGPTTAGPTLTGGRLQLVPVPPPQQQREIIHVFSVPVSSDGVVHPQVVSAPPDQQVHRIELSTQNPLTRQLGQFR